MKSRGVQGAMPRREFLRMSATAAVGLAASGLITPQRMFAATVDGLPLLSVGFAGAFPEPQTRVQLSDASSILSSDPSFLARRAHVTVLGYGRSEKTDMPNSAIELAAIYPALSRNPEQYPRFTAWQFQTNGATKSEGGCIQFTMPVTTDGLQFDVREMPKRNEKGEVLGTPRTSRLAFGLGSESAIKLQRGVYVIAFRESSSDSVPSWSRFSVQNENGFLTVPQLGVTYAVIRIDYADDAQGGRRRATSK